MILNKCSFNLVILEENCVSSDGCPYEMRDIWTQDSHRDKAM